MSKLFAELGLSNIDRSFVSRGAAQIDEEVEIWKNRPLDRRYAYIWLDAIYTKIRIEAKRLDGLNETDHDISIYLDFLTANWNKIKCTNSLERSNEELRR